MGAKNKTEVREVKAPAAPGMVTAMMKRLSIVAALAVVLSACGTPSGNGNDSADEDGQGLVTTTPDTVGSGVSITVGGIEKATISTISNTSSGGFVVPLTIQNNLIAIGGGMNGLAVTTSGPSLQNVVRVIAWLDRPPYQGTVAQDLGTEDRRIFDTGNTVVTSPTNGLFENGTCPAIAANIPASSAGVGPGTPPVDFAGGCIGANVRSASAGNRSYGTVNPIDLSADPAVAADTLHLIRFEFFTCASSLCNTHTDVVRIATTVNYSTQNPPFAVPAAPAVGDIVLSRDSQPSFVLNRQFDRAACSVTVANSDFDGTETITIGNITLTATTDFTEAADSVANRQLVASRIVQAFNTKALTSAAPPNGNGNTIASYNDTNVITFYALARGAAGNSVTYGDESSAVTNNITNNAPNCFAGTGAGVDGTALASPYLIGDFPVQVPFGPVGYLHHFDGLTVTTGGSAVTVTDLSFAALNAAQSDLLLVETGASGGKVRSVIPALPNPKASTSTLNLVSALPLSSANSTYSIHHADARQLRMTERGTTTKGQGYTEVRAGSVDKAMVSGVIWDGGTATPTAPLYANDGAAQIATICNGACGGNNDLLIRANGPGGWGNSVTVQVITGGGANSVAVTGLAIALTLDGAATNNSQAVIDTINNNPAARALVTASCQSAPPCSVAGSANAGFAVLAATNLTGGRGSNVTNVVIRATNLTNSTTTETTTLVSRSATAATYANTVLDSAAVADDAILLYALTDNVGGAVTNVNGATATYIALAAAPSPLLVTNTGNNISIRLERPDAPAVGQSTAEEVIEAINKGHRATRFAGTGNSMVRFQARTPGTTPTTINVAIVNNVSPSVAVTEGGTIDIVINVPVASTTANTVVSMVNASSAASKWIIAKVPNGTNGTGLIAALASGPLTGGAAPLGWIKAMPARGNTGSGIPLQATTAGVFRGGATSGQLVSSNPNISVGLYWGGDCLPSNVTLPHELISAPYAAICYMALLPLTEGDTKFEVRATDSAGNPTNDNTCPTAGAPLDYCDYPAASTLIVDSTPPMLLSQYGGGMQADTTFQNEKVWVQGASNPGAGAYQTFAQTVSIRGLVKDFQPGTTTISDTGTRDSGRTYVRVQSDYTAYDSFATSGGTDTRGSPIPATDADTATTADRGYYQYDNVPLRPGGITSFTVTAWDQSGNSVTTNFQVQQFLANTTTPPHFTVDCVVDNIPATSAGVQVLACEDDDFSPSPNSPLVIRTQEEEAAAAAGDPYQNDPSLNGRYGDSGESTLANRFTAPVTGTVPAASEIIVAANKVSFSGRFTSLDGLPPTALVNGSGGIFSVFDIMPRGFGAGLDVVGTVTAVNGAQITLSTSVTGDNLRPGDAIVLSSVDNGQSSNIGLYEINGCTTDAAGACTGTVLTLNRSLQSATGTLFYQAAYIWMANNIDVPSEGINGFTFSATDSLGNLRTVSFPVLRDRDPPSIVIQGVFVDPNSTEPVEMQSVNPIVFLTDATMFFGTNLTTPRSYISVLRKDSNGEGQEYTVTSVGAPANTTFTSTTAGNACFRAVNECADKVVIFTAGTAANLGVSRSIASSTVGGQIIVSSAFPANVTAGDTYIIVPATEHFVYTGSPTGVVQGANRSSSLDPWDNNAGTGAANYSCSNGFNLSGVNALGQATAATRSSPTGAKTLTCDFSCSDKDGTTTNQCIPGLPLTYQVNVFAIDYGGSPASADVTFSLVESSAGALLGGALGILSRNPAVVATLSDPTGLRTLTIDQLSNSGVLYNLNYRIASLLGDPNQPLSSTVNARANFYIDQRESFGNLLGTILDDPDGAGTSQSTAVTLSNVVRILLDNGVFDDLLPILDNTQILDPKGRTNFPNTPVQGDASKMADFTEQLFRSPTATPFSCNTGSHAETTYTCYNQAGPIKETFDAIKATLDFNDALRSKNASTKPRVSGSDANLAATTITSATAQFRPVAGTPTSPVNVQVGDIVTITQIGSICNGATATVTSVSSSTVLNTTSWGACAGVCAGACDYTVTPPAGPSLNTIIELADVALFADLDRDGTGGEREAIQAILHMMEEAMRNRETAPYTNIGDYDRTSLVCPYNYSGGAVDNCRPTGSGGLGATTAAQMTDSFLRSRNIQGSMDLFAELADNGVAGDGEEFISQLMNLVNFLLKEGSQAGVAGGPPDGSTNIEAMSFITRDMLNSLFVEPTFGGVVLEPMTSTSTRQNTRLNLLLRSITALSYDRTNITINFGGGNSTTAQNALEASLSLIHTLTNDPDDNPRGCANPACGVLVDPNSGTNAQKSVMAKLESPLNTLLKDARFPNLLDNLKDILDPGTGISDLTAFQYGAYASGVYPATISEDPFTSTAPPNPYRTNPPLLSVLMQFSKTTIDQDAENDPDIGEPTPIDIGVNALNVLLTPVGTISGGDNYNPTLGAVSTDVCRENYFAGTTPMEKLLNILAQLSQPATKDPKDFSYQNRTLPDCHATVAEGDPKSDNRSYIRIILDALGDNPALDDDGSAATTTSVVMPNAFSTLAAPTPDGSSVNGWDDVPYSDNPGFRSANLAFATNITTGGCGPGASGSRTASGGDGLAVPQRTLDILPELLNTIARYGFHPTTDRLTSIFAGCTGAACLKNKGNPASSDRYLSGQRLAVDLGLMLDQPLQVGGGTTGIVQFEQSLTREFIEAIANLSTKDSVNAILLLADQMAESITPITGTINVPNPADITRSTSLVRSLADPDGDGDPLPDGLIDDLVPLIQSVAAAGMTQQVLDLLRSIRACGVDTVSANKDVRGGEFFLEVEDVTLTMLDAFSGALKDSNIGGFVAYDPTASGGTAPSVNTAGLCPQEAPAPGSSGLMGGILDSNPNGAISATYPVNRGVLVGGDDVRLFACDNEGGIGGAATNCRVFAGNWASVVNGSVASVGGSPASVFDASGLSLTADLYVGSLLTVRTGNASNVNRSRVITAYTVGGQVTVDPPFPANLAAGNTFEIVAPSNKFGQLGLGIDSYFCVMTSASPYDENCGRILQPNIAGSSPYSVAPVNVTGGYVRFQDATEAGNLNLGGVSTWMDSPCDQRDAPAGVGNCSYRIRQMREPYNGCVGGMPFGVGGMGVGLSSANGYDPIPQNSFRDSRLDLILRQLNFLMNGGNDPNLTTTSFSRRIGNLLSTVATPDTGTGDPSLLSIFMFGSSVGETGPVQALLNDTSARSALAGTLNLFAQTSAAVQEPSNGRSEDVFDRYPNFSDNTLPGPVGGVFGFPEPVPPQVSVAGNCLNTATTCDGNAIHDAVDYQLLALQGVLGILGDRDGADNTTGLNVTANDYRQAWSDDPSVLFNLAAQMFQEKYIGNLFPGLQILAEATTAVPMNSMDVRADPENTNDPDANGLNKIEAKALSRITRRIARSFNGGEECDPTLVNNSACNWAPGSYALNQQGGILQVTGAGVNEGPIQALMRDALVVLEEWQANHDYGTGATPTVFGNTSSWNNHLERSRFVALEDLAGVLTGATGGPKHLNKALRVLYDIVRDTETVQTAAATRSINKILSVQVGLAQRGVVDTEATNKSALDVIADFINTLVEDPTDCNTGLPGFQRGSGTASAPACEIAGAGVDANPNAVFRDVGTLLERPIQPILDPTAFQNLSQIFAGGDNSKITGALPFLAAMVQDTHVREIQNKEPTSASPTVIYRGVEYSAGVRIADALFNDLQDLIPNSTNDENRYDPLLTDDLNRNGVLDAASTVLVGFGDSKNGAGQPWFSIFDAPAMVGCTAANCPKNEADNYAYDCSPPEGSVNGTAIVACTNAVGDPLALKRVQIGYTASDGAVTLGNVNGINAAFFDSLADLIAYENTANAVNNQLPRTNTGQTMDQYTARNLGAVSVDPSFNDLITALGDLLLASNQ